MQNEQVTKMLYDSGWFQEGGAYVLVDGQFGSTGKGLLADVLSYVAKGHVDYIVTNAGPNSGHTARFADGSNIMTQQLPVMSVMAKRQEADWPSQPITILNGGAIIDMDILADEMSMYGVDNVWVSTSAAVISAETSAQFNSGSMDSIASTGKGIGQAMASKILRKPTVVSWIDAEGKPQVSRNLSSNSLLNSVLLANGVQEFTSDDVIFVETAQGFSLGINSGFYPYTTSRECTVAQALADAGISPKRLRKTIMAVRTYPIRVGNTSMGNSGPCYYDQEEIKWEDIGVDPELTTVTKRIRRLFTWSETQFRQAVIVNHPDVVFLNFCNYLSHDGVYSMACEIQKTCLEVMGYNVDLILGFGPRADQVCTMNQFVNGWECPK